MTEYRRATSADAEQLAELRAVMVEAIAGHVDTAAPWFAAAVEWFRVNLDRDDVAAFIAIDDGVAVAGALGQLSQHAPSPRNLSGRVGYLSSVATRDTARRQGHSRHVVGMLVDWFDEEGAGQVDLTATADGIALYRSLGFVDSEFPALRRTRPEETR